MYTKRTCRSLTLYEYQVMHRPSVHLSLLVSAFSLVLQSGIVQLCNQNCAPVVGVHLLKLSFGKLWFSARGRQSFWLLSQSSLDTQNKCFIETDRVGIASNVGFPTRCNFVN